MKILMVLTSHGQLGTTGKATGLWLEEFAAPYYVFVDAGVQVTLASPRGGQPPIDPKSDALDDETESIRRFRHDQQAQAALANTTPLASVKAEDYDAIFYPGGHGPLWDLAEDKESIALIEAAYAAGKSIAAVCHGPAVFRHSLTPDGKPLVRDRRVTGFTNSEEAAVELTDVVPFLVEEMLSANGGHFKRAADWAPFCVTDGNLITGQNPASSGPAAEALLAALRSA